MRTKKLMGCFILSLISWGMYAQGQLISRLPEGGIGKQIVSIHSSSGQAAAGENAINLLIANTTGNNTKWCDNTNAQPWVIFELLDYYNVDKFVYEDVTPFEAKANVDGYQIYVTDQPYDDVIGGWDDSDWELVVDKTSGQGDLTVKTDVLATPKKARYVKFLVTQKGIYPDGSFDNAVRIYSFDIYGTFAEKIDRGNLVSVGKTIMAFYDAFNVREVPIHILDANMSYIYNKWCFRELNDNENYKYVVIDLEKQYDISRFKVWDAQSVESGDNLLGCNIYVSTWSPNLSLISTIEDTNDCWTEIVDSEGEEYDNIKEYTSTSSSWRPSTSTVTGRFVKLEFPYDKVVGTSRIFQFEVFGTETVIPDNDATLSLLTVSAGALSPSFSGNETNYTLDVDKEVDKLVINAAATNTGATVIGTGEHALTIGNNNVFNIEVTAKDGVTKKTYTLTVTRADKSKIATLSSLSVSTGYLSPEFKPDVLKYAVDVASNVRNITLNATSTDANATIEGLGNKTLSGAENEFEITVIAEDRQTTEVYTVTVYVAPEGLISVSRPDGRGKRIANIHSYSGKVNDTENPYKLLLGKRLNTNGDTGNKWCDNSGEHWVIFSLPDIYHIDRIVFRDGRLMEPNNGNVHNVEGYDILVSTTGTKDLYGDSDFSEVVWESGKADENTKEEEIDADARYVKINFYGEVGTIWIYGVDIYGTLAERVDRDGVVSVGKTIADYNFAWSDRETPANLIDGNIDRIEYDENYDEIAVKHDPWAINRDHNGAWVTIDLEDVYDINKFVLYDAA
ncbi:MAG: discoidin domain-containing protein, partial [Dysgonamonadaceae bacterium]|nr:discoidin domain-containing protein [Dysgonamonadaceae bacterium]